MEEGQNSQWQKQDKWRLRGQEVAVAVAAKPRPTGRRLFKGRMRQRQCGRWRRTNRLVDGEIRRPGKHSERKTNLAEKGIK